MWWAGLHFEQIELQVLIFLFLHLWILRYFTETSPVKWEKRWCWKYWMWQQTYGKHLLQCICSIHSSYYNLIWIPNANVYSVILSLCYVHYNSFKNRSTEWLAFVLSVLSVCVLSSYSLSNKIHFLCSSLAEIRQPQTPRLRMIWFKKETSKSCCVTHETNSPY